MTVSVSDNAASPLALPDSTIVGVVGAGTMGSGIAQVAATAGHEVRLFDATAGAAEKGRTRVGQALDRLVSSGRLDASGAAAILRRIRPSENLAEFADAGLVIEAIVEDLEIKRGLFASIEAIVGDETILATNTSSISVTAIAAELRRPQRLAGLHFFNPAPVMKLVEVVSGLATAPTVADTLLATARAWNKVPVKARSTPGFIVNRVARPYYGEALRLLEEQVVDAATLDALMCESGGFRMGPFALMDLIGNDVNFTVSQSVYDAYFQDPRFRPSSLQREMKEAGWLGRKSGRGFYDYSEGAPRPAPATTASSDAAPFGDFDIARGRQVVDGIVIAQTDGATAASQAKRESRPVILFDLILDPAKARRIGYASSPDVPAEAKRRFVASLAAAGKSATHLPDWPGLVVMRTVAMLANEAFDTMLQGVASEPDIDLAMKFGVNYPLGPLEWARKIGLDHVLAVVDAVFEETRDPRYRASQLLRRAAERA
jgi:3-hydroxybutyryl-CoA dehydrogenase